VNNRQQVVTLRTHRQQITFGSIAARRAMICNRRNLRIESGEICSRKRLLCGSSRAISSSVSAPDRHRRRHRQLRLKHARGNLQWIPNHRQASQWSDAAEWNFGILNITNAASRIGRGARFQLTPRL